MKLKFKKQQFQSDAVAAVVDLFKGQASSVSPFTVGKLDIIDYAQDSVFGYGNTLTLTAEEITRNLHEVQQRNLLPLTEPEQLRFNIEMETGTGKTFVYTKTIYELNKRYGFNKFVILVPSVAIREGAYKSLQITEEYFRQEYDGKRAHFFIYDSKKRNEVRDFALSTNLEIMIVNIDAIKKDENLFNQESDKMDKTAREFMAQCRPILIIDEPQSIDNTDKSRKAIENLNPLCELRYSATHKQVFNIVYRLTPVDAYQMNIVKQICVANQSLMDDFNKPYIRLLEVGKKSSFYAKVEIDVKSKATGIVKREVKTVKQGDSLFAITGREIYEGYDIAGIDCTEGWEQIEFANTEVLALHKAIGAVDEMTFKREQIKRTIEIHLEKEKRYLSRGIKVLSLFFIDEVAKYRDYEQEDGKGIYAKMFEELYAELIEQPRFSAVKEFYKQSASEVHNGYFSCDKKGRVKDTKGDTADDYSTYNTIMKDKEWLLSFDCPLRFIFSHSALKEGWDNPNVFQICTLIENKTVFTCRQKIGRGLRLCVDQSGERIDDKNVNILHVIAQESFAEFADKLQKEIEELGVKFGVLDADMFVNISYEDETGAEAVITIKDAGDILEHFRKKNYIDSQGKIKDTLKNDLANGTVDLPARFEAARQRLLPIIGKANTKVNIKPERKQVSVKRRDEMFMNPLFMELWDKMKQKTIYRINMDIQYLIEKSLKEISEMPEIRKSRILKEVASFNIKKSGVDYKESASSTSEYEQELPLPDVVRILADSTKLPRNNIAQILLECGRLKDFLNNPEKFIEVVAGIIERNKTERAIDGIKYIKLDGQEYTFYEVFNFDEEKDIIAFEDINAIKVEHSVYDYVIYDSDTVERPFAEALDSDPDVKLFFKIPQRFKISTPLSNYSPDWAVYMEKEGEKKMYFVLETKGTTDEHKLRPSEQLKIRCGREHFKVLGNEIEYEFTKDWQELKRNKV